MWAAEKGGLIVFCQQIPLRRLSADQHRCDHLVYRFADRCVFAVFMFFNLLHQKFHRFSSEHIDLLSHGADREDGVSGGGGVVEADDQVVFREFTVFSYQQVEVQTAILLSLNAKTKSDPAKHIVKFDAPYTYNGEEKADIKGKTFESVDLSGVGELNTMSESMAENRLAGYGFTPVNTGHNYAYVCIIASMGTGYPVDYFTGLPLCEAAKLRDAVDADFFE